MHHFAHPVLSAWLIVGVVLLGMWLIAMCLWLWTNCGIEGKERDWAQEEKDFHMQHDIERFRKLNIREKPKHLGLGK